MSTQVIRGWTVEYERPWWYADKAGQQLRAGTPAQLIRMISKREA